jgi:hypothetical protein
MVITLKNGVSLDGSVCSSHLQNCQVKELRINNTTDEDVELHISNSKTYNYGNSQRKVDFGQ